MLYTIRSPRIRKVAVVKRPASGHRFHLLKEAGMHDDFDDDGGIAGALAGLADEVYLFEQAQAARAMIAKAEQAQRTSADRMLAQLAKQAGDPPPTIAAADLAALGRLARREGLRERVAGNIAAGQTPDPTRLPWLVNPTTASVDEHIWTLEQLAAHG